MVIRVHVGQKECSKNLGRMLRGFANERGTIYIFLTASSNGKADLFIQYIFSEHVAKPIVYR